MNEGLAITLTVIGVGIVIWTMMNAIQIGNIQLWKTSLTEDFTNVRKRFIDAEGKVDGMFTEFWDKDYPDNYRRRRPLFNKLEDRDTELQKQILTLRDRVQELQIHKERLEALLGIIYNTTCAQFDGGEMWIEIAGERRTISLEKINALKVEKV